MKRTYGLGGLSAWWIWLFIGAVGSAEARNADGKTIAVLEYRAGTTAAHGIGNLLAQRIRELTIHGALSPKEARLKHGASLDGDVAACEGQPSCVAKIADKLACDEAILIGISQLGDIIIAVQRIQVSTAEVNLRLADSIRRRRDITTRVVDRILRRIFPQEDFRRYGRIVIDTQAADDAVLVDGQLRGKTPIDPLRVPAPAQYEIRIRREKHIDFVARIDVLPRSTIRVKPTLAAKQAVAETRWYKKWWVWAIAGGVVAAGAATAIALTTMDRSNQVNAVITWP